MKRHLTHAVALGLAVLSLAAAGCGQQTGLSLNQTGTGASPMAAGANPLNIPKEDLDKIMRLGPQQRAMVQGGLNRMLTRRGLGQPIAPGGTQASVMAAEILKHIPKEEHDKIIGMGPEQRARIMDALGRMHGPGSVNPTGAASGAR